MANSSFELLAALFIGLETTTAFAGRLRRIVAQRCWPAREGMMVSTKTMLLGVLILLLGLGVIITTSSQAPGTPLNLLLGSLSSDTLRIIDYSGYALILLGLIVGLIGLLRKNRGPTAREVPN